jgi:hypothetical protein
VSDEFAPHPLQCARCARAPRDPDDRTTWVMIDDDRICPGCLTLTDREQLRTDEER